MRIWTILRASQPRSSAVSPLGHAGEHEQPRADCAGDAALDRHPGMADSLDHGAHVTMLAHHMRSTLVTRPSSKRIVVTVCGSPGAGRYVQRACDRALRMRRRVRRASRGPRLRSCRRFTYRRSAGSPIAFALFVRGGARAARSCGGRCRRAAPSQASGASRPPTRSAGSAATARSSRPGGQGDALVHGHPALARALEHPGGGVRNVGADRRRERDRQGRSARRRAVATMSTRKPRTRGP